jgi:hypothetical protein
MWSERHAGAGRSLGEATQVEGLEAVTLGMQMGVWGQSMTGLGKERVENSNKDRRARSQQRQYHQFTRPLQ